MRGKSLSIVLALVATSLLAGCIDLAKEPISTANVIDVGQVNTDRLFFHRGLSLSLSELDLPLVEALRNSTSLPFYTGQDGVEPTVGVTKDGTLFVSAGTFRNNNPLGLPWTLVMKSEDKGLTWKSTGPRLPNGDPNPPITFDPYVYVDPATDRVFTVDLYALACNWLSYSDDKGQSWITNPIACGDPLVVDHQTIVAGKPKITPVTPAYPNLLYICINHVYKSSCARSIDGGLSFHELPPAYSGVSPPAPGSGEQASFCGGLHGHVKTGPDGTVYLPRGYCGKVMVAVSETDGLLWTPYVINETVGILEGTHEITIATDPAGNVYAMWPAEDGLMRLAASKDKGKTWGPAHILSAPDVTLAGYPAIAAGDDGKLAFAYYGTTYEGGIDAKESIATEGTWNGYLGYVLDALSDDPLVVTTMVNDPNDPLVRGKCAWTRCPGVYDFMDIVIDAEGRPWAAFVDACTGKCATSEGEPNKVAPGAGFVAALSTGPALRGNGTLAALVPQTLDPATMQSPANAGPESDALAALLRR
ncbi:MAG TPA: sialidase family protein [Candidatus Thermoplasmatota archaeon]|nr:sialidase family protein [Candidatus Thermoplasmatota archaeon]